MSIAYKSAPNKIESADQMSQQQRESFFDGSKTVVLPAGTVLYRFISAKTHWAYSDCWVDQPTFVSMVKNINNIQQLNKEQKQLYIRHNLGILEDWNSTNFRVKVRLKKDMVAHIGIIGPQKVYTKSTRDFGFRGPSKTNKSGAREINRPTVMKMTELKVGGYTQYVIPRFKNDGIKEEGNPWAEELHRGKTSKDRRGVDFSGVSLR